MSETRWVRLMDLRPEDIEPGVPYPARIQGWEGMVTFGEPQRPDSSDDLRLAYRIPQTTDEEPS